MGVKLARTAGFCMGVRRAVDMVLDIARKGGKGPIYTYGPLIHNPQTIALLKKRGVLPVENLDEIDSGTIVIRAHGIPPAERSRLKEKGLEIIDATCPKVARVQGIIRKHHGQGHTILILGDRDHPEVTALLGYAGDRGFIVNGMEDLMNLPDFDRVCVVAQTTQNVEEFERMARAIQKKYPGAVIFNTICDSTVKRQDEVRDMAGKMDAMIIVGGKNSANTERLRTISEDSGTPTFLVETAGELQKIDLDPFENIGVSAGASTPNWIINGVLDHIAGKGREKRGRLGTFLYSLWLWTVKTDVFKAVGASSLTLAAQILQGLPPNPLNLLISAFYVHAMHSINRIQEKSPLEDRFREGEKPPARHRKAFVGLASLGLALFLSALTGLSSFLLLLFISFVGLLYDIPLLPSHWSIRKISAIPGSKNFLMAVAWATVCAALPQVEAIRTAAPATAVAFIFVFALVFIVSSLADLMDIQGDRLVGRETIPVIMGEKKTRAILQGGSLLLGILLVLSYGTGLTPSFTLALLTSLIYLWICFLIYDRRFSLSALAVEGFLETNLVLPGALAGLWLYFS